MRKAIAATALAFAALTGPMALAGNASTPGPRFYTAPGACRCPRFYAAPGPRFY